MGQRGEVTGKKPHNMAVRGNASGTSRREDMSSVGGPGHQKLQQLDAQLGGRDGLTLALLEKACHGHVKTLLTSIESGQLRKR